MGDVKPGVFGTRDPGKLVFFLLERNINEDTVVRSIRFERSDWYQFVEKQQALYKHELIREKISKLDWKGYRMVEMRFYLHTEDLRKTYMSPKGSLWYAGETNKSKLLNLDPHPPQDGEYLKDAPTMDVTTIHLDHNLSPANRSNQQIGRPIGSTHDQAADPIANQPAVGHPNRVNNPNGYNSNQTLNGNYSTQTYYDSNSDLNSANSYSYGYPNQAVNNLNHATNQTGLANSAASNSTALNPTTSNAIASNPTASASVSNASPIISTPADQPADLKPLDLDKDDPEAFMDAFEERFKCCDKKEKFKELLKYMPDKVKKFVINKMSKPGTWGSFVESFVHKYQQRYLHQVEDLENQRFDPESGQSLTEFVESRFRLYDDHQKGVPESVQIWSTINHIDGDLKQKLCYNRDTSRSSFIERCRLIESAGDDESDYSDEENERPIAVRNGGNSPAIESNDQSDATNPIDQSSTPTYAASEDSSDDRPMAEEEEEEEDREVILIEDSDEEVDEGHPYTPRSIKREYSQTSLKRAGEDLTSSQKKRRN